MPFNKLKHFRVSGQITFFGHFIHDLPVLFLIFVEMGIPDIEERIVPDPERLMHLKVKTN
jgi:hypothetical protein